MIKRKKNEVVGFISSSWDLLHAGHCLILEQANQICDILIVGLQSDPTIDRPEKNKPTQGLFERYIQLDSNKNVDYIIPYDSEEDLLNLLKTVPITIIFQGEDHKGKPFTGDELNITNVYLPRYHNYSTTKLKMDIKDG